jgi:hypothetical protein
VLGDHDNKKTSVVVRVAVVSGERKNNLGSGMGEKMEPQELQTWPWRDLAYSPSFKGLPITL